MKLKELRENNHMSQTEFAKIMNIKRVTYNKYELGTNEPNLDILKQIANYYNVSLDYLCDRQWNNNIGYIPEKRKQIIASILALSDDDFDKLNYYIKGFLDGHSKEQEINFYNPGDEV